MKPVIRRTIIRSAFVALVTVLFAVWWRSALRTEPGQDHNCRMWAMVTDEPFAALDTMIRQHHDSLRSLGSFNADGWGISYYDRLADDALNPVIRRGEPNAPSDPRYPVAVEEMISRGSRAALSHVRRAVGSLVIGLPDPHPFDRSAVRRPLRVLFAHNGSFSSTLVVDLINALDPGYFRDNPPDYYPNYLDSDLYLIYLLETMDTYLDSTIEACVRIAVSRIDSALGLAAVSSYLNFVMTDGATVWAAHYTDDLPNSYPMYYFPDTGRSGTWIAASLPMGKPDTLWSEVPNYTMVTLVPGQPPVFTALQYPSSVVRYRFRYDLDIAYAHYEPRVIVITYSLPRDEPVNIDVFDCAGRRLNALYDGPQSAGSHVIYWNGRDDRGRRLPAGKYFCVLTASGAVLNADLTLLP